ncbi:epoxyqueuosine reductase QueH [Helicobacter equorum]|uniref:epoxyqueuosine reductase QueH n=1 Tax=Helicobacter equorum TaxID=361872 RepID=UPI000CF14E83|nr:epoxyqueuosine reductase QueH [Helicobacter equorum]
MNVILVHICCSVDSHYFLQRLREQYPDSKLVGYFYNPNIHPKTEYDLRLLDVERSCKMLGIELYEGEYDTLHWLEDVRGLEEEPEKGDRCVACFDSRLIRTASFAKQKGIGTFTTTLLSSPMKERDILFAQGEKIARMYNLAFIKIDVRSNGGTQAQAQLAKKDNLYRQTYCGCKFALIKQRNAQGKLSLELVENLGRQVMPASNEERIQVFSRRNALEEEHVPYILTKRSIMAWRNLRSTAKLAGQPIDMYVLADSKEKHNAKTGEIQWMHTDVLSPYSFYKLLYPKDMKYFQDINHISKNSSCEITIGVASKDDSIFLCLQDVNTLCNTQYQNIRELNINPLPYELESVLRICLCGLGSINPIIVLDSRVESSLTIFIHSLFQEENVFRLIEGKRTHQDNKVF